MEFNSSSVYDRSHHDAWDMDRDGFLSEAEFVNGIYGAYDEDGDRMLDNREFAEYADDAKRLWPQVDHQNNPPRLNE
jgi:hypothetical protein